MQYLDKGDGYEIVPETEGDILELAAKYPLCMPCERIRVFAKDRIWHDLLHRARKMLTGAGKT